MERRVPRRRFLSASLGALGAPALLRAAALAGGGRAAANDRVGVGHIGVGGRGGWHLAHYASHGSFPSVAVCDVDRSFRQKAAAQVGTPCRAYDDYRRLLDDRDVDAVVIATPEHWHALPAIHASEAGKDVYCEKPLSLTVREARAMVRAARRYARVFQTGSQQRSAREFRRAAELVRNGKIGELKGVRVDVWGTSRPCHLPAEPVPEGLDWDAWLGPAPWRDYNRKLHPARWRSFREFSGGTMTDWGAHHLDIVQWALGMDGSGPVEILPPSGGARHVTLRYSSGIAVRCGRTGVNGIEFTGSKGKVTVNRGFFEAEPEEIGRAELAAGDVHLYQSSDHHRDWEERVRDRGRPICDVEIGCRSVTCCHLSNLAIWLGRPIRWDPEKEEIVGDRVASRWLDRPMRAPYCL